MAEWRGEGMVVVLGRGHTGTRAIARMLMGGGVFMGKPLNGTADLMPRPNGMYQAARLAGAQIKVDPLDPMIMEFQGLHSNPPPEFRDYVLAYLRRGGILRARRESKRWVGWKLPETCLTYPWLVHMFPQARYLLWSRHPFRTIQKAHGTDKLQAWGVDVPELDTHASRLVSWYVQTYLLLNTPSPEHHVVVSHENWCHNETHERLRITQQLGVPVSYVEPQLGRATFKADVSAPEHIKTACLRLWDAWQARASWVPE